MAARVREPVCWSPLWDGPIRVWTLSFIRKNKWRCERIHDADDLLSDAFLVYMKIERRYPRVVEPQHFMALYKTAIQNSMWDKTRYLKKRSQALVDLAIDAGDYGADRIGEVTNSGYLGALLAEAPDEVKFALTLFSDAELAAELFADTARTPCQRPQPHENLNMRLSRAMGFRQVRFDFVGALKTLLT